MARITVFCGARAGTSPEYLRCASELGHRLASRGLGLVYGGGAVGMMGAVADAAPAAGGEVIGVIPESLMARELAHPGLTELRVTSDLQARKLLMAQLADAFIVLPGGFGTLDELFEIVSWRQLGLERRRLGLYDTRGYFRHLLGFLDHAVEEGFILPAERPLVFSSSELDSLLAQLLPEAWPAPQAR